MHPMAAPNESFWLRRAQREAWRFNTGWWVQFFLPWVVGLGILASVSILALRSADRDPNLAAIPLAALVLAAVVTSLVLARRKFLSKAEALTRLDADLHLRNRLTSAVHGVGEWPQRRDDAALALNWKWSALLWPPAAAFALVCAALLIPLPEASAKATLATAEPPAWTSTQEKLEALRKDEIVQRESVEQFQAALDALRKQPSDQWFRHESLEAGDNLQNQLGQSLANLQKNLETSLGALEAAREIEQVQLQALGQPLDKALSEALQGMELGKLPLDEKMLSQLKNLDASKIRKLSAAEWKQLSEKMKAGIGTCSGGFCKGDKAGSNLLAIIMSQNGNGGVNRGPGTAPLTFSDQETNLGTTKTEAVQNDDLSNAALGDLMGLGKGEHKVDKNAESGPESGGAMSAAGSGSEAVWQQTATPAEQGALKKFFQ
jgi:hypothetical protein